MSNPALNTKKPIAVVYAPEGGVLADLLDGLDCPGFRVYAVGERSALAALPNVATEQLGAFILDVSSPEDVPANLVQELGAEYREAGGPVILVVDSNKANYDEDRLLEAGGSKVFDARLGQRALRLVVSTEIEEFGRICQLRRELQRRASAIGQIVKGQFQFRTRREAQNLATMLSMTCPDPMPIAIGLTELFINGVEHGCLGIGHSEKGELIEKGRLAEEIDRRRQLPENRDKVVTVNFRREENRLYFEVKDEGKGFDYSAYLHETEGHSKKHGRGIMMAKGCFERLEYKGSGNEVHAVHSFDPV